METWSLTLGSFQLNIIDVIILGLVFLSAILGAFKGFAREFASRFGFIIGILVAGLFNTMAARLIWNTFSLPVLWSSFIAFLVVFLITYFIMLSLGNALESILDAIHFGWLDSILGLALGAAEMVVIVTIVIYVINLQSILDLSSYFTGSELYNRFIIHFIQGGLASVSQAVDHV